VVDLVLVALSARDLDGDVELHVFPFFTVFGCCLGCGSGAGAPVGG
jgi:hypothetical protein